MITFYKLSNGNVRLTINGEVYLLNPSLSVIPLQSENDRIIITNNLTYPIKNGLDILISSISYPTFTDRNDLINILGTYYENNGFRSYTPTELYGFDNMIDFSNYLVDILEYGKIKIKYN